MLGRGGGFLQRGAHKIEGLLEKGLIKEGAHKGGSLLEREGRERGPYLREGLVSEDAF